MTGSISGLKLDRSLHDLARTFHLTLEALALQTRHIVDTMNRSGHEIRALYMSGGQAKNAKLMQLLADVCGVPVVLPASTSDAVTRGAAMLGRFAAENARGQGVEGDLGESLWGIMVRIYRHFYSRKQDIDIYMYALF